MNKVKHLVVILALVLMLTLSACGGNEGSGIDPTALPYTSNEVDETTSDSAEVVAGRPAEGEIIFQANCSACHDIAEDSTIEGPSLFGAGARLDYDFVKQSILFPTEHISFVDGMVSDEETTMPTNFQEYLTAQQLDDVIAYVLSIE